VAGLGISWLRDNLGIVSGPQEAESLAASVSVDSVTVLHVLDTTDHAEGQPGML
jgi:glycerol kinase